MAGSITAETVTATRLWANSIGIPDETIDAIFQRTVDQEWAWALSGVPTAIAKVTELLRPHFVAMGFPSEVADRFTTAHDLLHASNKELTVAIFVPDITGMTEADASAYLSSIGLALGVVTTTADQGTPFLVGEIAAQNPAANASAIPAATVAVTVQKGQLVPVVVGETYTDAKTALLAQGFAIAASIVDETGTAGDVFASDPAAGTWQDYGSGVALDVIGVEVPDFAGNTEDEYTIELEALALVAGTVTSEHDDTVTAGDIIRIAPVEVGDMVTPETVVHMVVSGGPAYVAQT
jgi:beta-lactam-binding protein with PASTA domain